MHLKDASMTADGRQPHILVVNDTQEILDLIQTLLEVEGYRVTTSLALLNMDKVKAYAPDVIVQDLLFEGTQELGWKFLTLVRLDPELARIPLILCTAATRTANAHRAGSTAHIDQVQGAGVDDLWEDVIDRYALATPGDFSPPAGTASCWTASCWTASGRFSMLALSTAGGAVAMRSVHASS